MPTFQRYIDLFVGATRGSAATLFTSRKDTTPVATPQWIERDRFLLRVHFLDWPATQGAECDDLEIPDGDALVIAGKPEDAPDGDFLFKTVGFSVATFDSTKHRYEAIVDLNTTEMIAAMDAAPGNQLRMRVTIQERDSGNTERLSFTFPLIVLAAVISGEEGAPAPATPGYYSAAEIDALLSGISAGTSGLKKLDTTGMTSFDDVAGVDISAFEVGDVVAVFIGGMLKVFRIVEWYFLPTADGDKIIVPTAPMGNRYWSLLWMSYLLDAGYDVMELKANWVKAGELEAANLNTGTVTCGAIVFGSEAFININSTDRFLRQSGLNIYFGSLTGPVSEGVAPGTQNVLVGPAIASMLDGAENCTAVGYSALRDLNTGSDNTAVGALASAAVTDGICNTAVGSRALQYAGDNGYNTAVGYNAGSELFTGSSNTLLGANTAMTYGSAYNCSAIGADALCIDSSDGMQLGSTSLQHLRTSAKLYCGGVQIGTSVGTLIRESRTFTATLSGSVAAGAVVSFDISASGMQAGDSVAYPEFSAVQPTSIVLKSVRCGTNKVTLDFLNTHASSAFSLTGTAKVRTFKL